MYDKIEDYICGPTVYSYPHIGNIFTIVKAIELVKKKGLINITDFDQKITNALDDCSIESIFRYTNNYTRYFIKILKQLTNINKISFKRCILSLKYINNFIKKLSEKGLLTIVPDGYVFKDNSFYIWKNRTTSEWHLENPLKDSSKGIPGWHTECAALIYAFCSKNLCHQGGKDLAEIHHKNEQLQLKPFDFKIKWKHHDLIQILSQNKLVKMSKSLKNELILNENQAFFNRYLYDKLKQNTKVQPKTIQELYKNWLINFKKYFKLLCYKVKSKTIFKKLSKNLKKHYPVKRFRVNKKLLKLNVLLTLNTKRKNYLAVERLRKQLLVKKYNHQFSNKRSYILPISLKKLF